MKKKAVLFINSRPIGLRSKTNYHIFQKSDINKRENTTRNGCLLLDARKELPPIRVLNLFYICRNTKFRHTKCDNLVEALIGLINVSLKTSKTQGRNNSTNKEQL